jgi:hypothetical protein
MFCKKERLVSKKTTLISAEATRVLVCTAIDMFMHELVYNAPMQFVHMLLMLRMAEGQTLRRPDHMFWYNIIFESLQ